MGNVLKVPPSISFQDYLEIASLTGFTHPQIKRLHERFRELDVLEKGYLDRCDFKRVEEFRDNPLSDRIMESFFAIAAVDDDQISFRDFVRVLAVFKSREGQENDTRTNPLNQPEHRLRFAFKMYDVNKNNFITKPEFKLLLNDMIGENSTTEQARISLFLTNLFCFQLNEITDRAMLEFDADNDGRLSFEEFENAMASSEVEKKMNMRL